jgi:HK97 family phage major capsid protein
VNPKEMREERARLFEQAKKINEAALSEKRAMKPEEQSSWDSLNAEMDRLGAEIDRSERLAKLEASFAAGREDVNGKTESAREERETSAEDAPSGQDRELALRAWMRVQSERAPGKAEAAAAKRLGVDLRAREFEITMPTGRAEKRDLSAVTAGSGGATVAEGFVNTLERSMLYYGPMRQVATVIRTQSGGPLPYPVVNDTGNTGELLAENTSVGTSVDPTFGAVTFNAYKYSSKLVLVPVELIEDSAFDIAAFLASALAERLGRKQNTDFTTANGASKPNGIVSASSLGVTAASTTAIAADELIDLMHSVDIAYRQLPGAGYMMADGTVKIVRKLKGGDGQYLWQPSMQAGQPSTLNGFPVYVNNDMPAATTGLKSVIFGAFSKYLIRDVSGLRVRRLVERYADTDQEGFIAFWRTDGDLLDSGTDPVKHLIQA